MFETWINNFWTMAKYNDEWIELRKIFWSYFIFFFFVFLITYLIISYKLADLMWRIFSCITLFLIYVKTFEICEAVNEKAFKTWAIAIRELQTNYYSSLINDSEIMYFGIYRVMNKMLRRYTWNWMDAMHQILLFWSCQIMFFYIR